MVKHTEEYSRLCNRIYESLYYLEEAMHEHGKYRSDDRRVFLKYMTELRKIREASLRAGCSHVAMFSSRLMDCVVRMTRAGVVVTPVIKRHMLEARDWIIDELQTCGADVAPFEATRIISSLYRQLPGLNGNVAFAMDLAAERASLTGR
jgi:hypothetical protein